ncbi:beta-lactamase-like protein [Globomyces pollinis-pini]|nr:beta-lactamase-like protein [Globomyces pollinis-pini]
MKYHYSDYDHQDLLIDLNGYRILIDLPNHFNLNWKIIDIILLSNYNNNKMIPWILNYTRFNGQILATLPTIHFTKLTCLDYLNQLKMKSLFHQYHQIPYTELDIQNTFENIIPIYYTNKNSITNELSITAVSSGTGLGSCNWIIQYNSIKICYSRNWCRKYHPYAKQIDLNSLKNIDVFMVTGLHRIKEEFIQQSQNTPQLITIWPKLVKVLNERGNVIFPIPPIEDTFQLLEILIGFLDSSSLKHIPIHIVSTTAKQALLYSNIFSEWMNNDRQALTMSAKHPLKHGNLMETNRIYCHSSTSELLEYPEPRLILCNDQSDEGHFEDLLLLSDTFMKSTFVIEDTSVESLQQRYPKTQFYVYQTTNKMGLMNEVKSICEIVKPKTIIDPINGLNGSIDMKQLDIGCSIGYEIMNQTIDDDMIEIDGEFIESKGFRPSHLMISSIK